MEDDQASHPIRPATDRPGMPAAYGVPLAVEGLLSWSWAEERLRRARHYWIGTADGDCRPHSVPVWGVWHQAHLYFGGHPRTRTLRNLRANPLLCVHIEDGEDIVILEGSAEVLTDRALLAVLDQMGAEKYLGGTGTEGSGSEPPEEAATSGDHVTYTLRPAVAFGWGGRFPADASRWRFEPD